MSNYPLQATRYHMPKPIPYGRTLATAQKGTALAGNSDVGFGRYVMNGPHLKAVQAEVRFKNVQQQQQQQPATSPAPARLSANKRRKAAPIMIEPSAELMSMTMEPLNVTIVARCVLAHSLPVSPRNGSSSKKRSQRDTPTASPTPPIGPPVHPYSRHSDLANTRSTIPSPHELARAERMEEEKARQKKENAAAARAAAAIARRRRALRSGGRSTPRAPSVSAAPATMIPPIQRAVAAQRARSAEAAAAEAHAAEAAAAGMPVEPEDENGGFPHRALKRTRSSNLVNGSSNGASVGSPLRTVTNGADDDAIEGVSSNVPSSNGTESGDGPLRKRSRLAESTLPPRTSSRRAASASPQGTSATLPDSSPRKSGPDTLSPDSTSMRRVVSATDTAGIRRSQQRTGSAGPEVRERSRREVQLPARLRD